MTDRVGTRSPFRCATSFMSLTLWQNYKLVIPFADGHRPQSMFGLKDEAACLVESGLPIALFLSVPAFNITTIFKHS